MTLPKYVDLEETLNIRIDKIQALMDANEGSASSFDVYFSYRKQFFEWAVL